MNILITGGLGHIGSFLIKNMPSFYNITVVDNLLTQRYCTLFNLKRKIKFIESDISELTTKEISNHDIVIHLAAITEAVGDSKHDSNIELINITKTRDFITKCTDANISKFIFPSSTSVYGSPKSVIYEDDPTVENPQSLYAKSKLEIENVLKTQTELNYLIFRFGTIFGVSPGMRFHTAINKFCYESSIGNPLTIWKENMNQTRPYLGLNDVLGCILFFLQNKPDITNQTYNVLTGNFELTEIIEMITNVVGELELNLIPSPLSNQFSYIVRDDKIRSLGYIPTDSLSHSIKQTLMLLKNLK